MTVQMWDLDESNAKPVVLEGHCNAVYSVAIQGNKVISGSRDKKL